jgi:hypothetical protein
VREGSREGTLFLQRANEVFSTSGIQLLIQPAETLLLCTKSGQLIPRSELQNLTSVYLVESPLFISSSLLCHTSSFLLSHLLRYSLFYFILRGVVIQHFAGPIKHLRYRPRHMHTFQLQFLTFNSDGHRLKIKIMLIYI